MIATPSLSAAVKTWNGASGTTSNWNDGGNWVGGVAPSAGDDLHFAGSTRTSPVQNFAATTSFASITFDSGAATFTLTAGNSITLTAHPFQCPFGSTVQAAVDPADVPHLVD